MSSIPIGVMAVFILLHLKPHLSMVVPANMEQQATALSASTPSRKEAGSRYYRNRYSTDPDFREKERQRAAAYIDSRRDHYKRLWAARYACKKAAAQAAAAVPAAPDNSRSTAASC
jgi:hypothetical protein